jgi:hypothetical protein
MRWPRYKRRDRELDRYLAACKGGKVQKARRIYEALDVSAQQQADQLLAEQNAYHLEQAAIAQGRADFYRRLVELMNEHGVETPADLPADVLDQIDREAEARGFLEGQGPRERRTPPEP